MINNILTKTLLALILGLLGILTSCNDINNKIFWVSGTDGHYNDFVFMAESNVLPIHADSLKDYLTPVEILSIENVTFKNFGTISENERFKVIVLLKEEVDSGRNYKFIIRTFNTKFKIIDSYELATWVDSENKYCFGSINEDLIIQRACNEGKEKNVFQIINDGRIVESSYLRKE